MRIQECAVSGREQIQVSFADEQSVSDTSIEDLDMESFEVYIQQVHRYTGILVARRSAFG